MHRLKTFLSRFVSRRRIDRLMMMPTGWHGTVDAIRDGAVHGWAARPGHPSPTIQLRLNGSPIGATRALAYRSDLESAPGVDPACGFTLPLLLPDDVRTGVLSVHLGAGYYPTLPGGRFSVEQARVMMGRR